MENFEAHVPRVIKTDNIKKFLLVLAEQNASDVFHVTDLDFFPKRLAFWRKHLPGVQPFYAIKTNHDGAIVAEQARLGLGFDCASVREVKQLVALNVDPDRIIFANPFKSQRTLDALHKYGVKRLVFDCIDELERLVRVSPDAELVLRIATDDSHSAIPLSAKFGAELSNAWALLDHAAKKGAHIVGVSFHVGSNCNHPPSYRKAILDAAQVLNYGRKALNLPMQLLDLGGGWPGAHDEAFETIARTVRETIREVIAPDVRVIAEPGTFFAAQSTTALLRVIGRREQRDSDGEHQHLFLASGIYGLFFCGYYFKNDAPTIARYGWQFEPLISPRDPTFVRTTLWGPTCDSVDKIVSNIMMPRVESSSWLYSHNVGSYSHVLENDFNQIDRSQPIYIRTGL